MHLNLAMDFGKYLPESVGAIKNGITRKYIVYTNPGVTTDDLSSKKIAGKN